MKKLVVILSFCIVLFGGVGFITYEDAIDQIAQKIGAYFEKFPTEKLYMHFAEDVWIAGQTVWCKGYLVRGKDFLPATESKVVYLEVVNAQGITVRKLNLNASNGLVRGSFTLPDSLSTGWYQVNAYTQWMLNFEASTHFTKPVLLVNPLQENPQNMPSPFTTAEERKVAMPTQKQILMEIEKAGISTMRVKMRRLDENFTTKNLYLIAVSGEKIVYTETLKLQASELETELPFNLFLLGTVQLALFDEKATLLDAQEIVIPSLSALTVEIQPDKTTYAPREKAALKLSLTDIQGKPPKAFASVTIRKKEALSGQVPVENIEQFLLLGDESMKKRAHDLPKDETRQSQPIIMPSSGFSWTKVVNQPLPVQQFTKEDEGITIKGKLLTPDGKPIADKRVILSVTGKDLWFQYDDTQDDGSFNLLIERVFGEKEVVIQAPELKKEYQIILDEEKNNKHPSLQPLRFGGEPQVLEDFIQKCRQQEKIYNTYAFYQQDLAANQSDKKRRNAPFRFYGVPNVELYLEDFIDLPNMEEICRELLPGVQLKVGDNQYDFNIFDVRTRTFLPDEPKLFVDGVLVYDKEKVANLPPENIEKIETVNRRTFYGDFRFDGVISIFTKAGNVYESMIPREALKTKLFFYNQSDGFPVIRYGEEEKRIPDLRTLIYWNPDIKFDEEGNLTLAYNHSDETGTFEIIVEGITTDGIPFSHSIDYEVVIQ